MKPHDTPPTVEEAGLMAKVLQQGKDDLLMDIMTNGDADIILAYMVNEKPATLMGIVSNMERQQVKWKRD